MVKLTKRKGFNFFRSYYDVYNELENNSDKVAFIDALLDRQFLGVKPLKLTGMAKFAYISQTNSIDSQVKGYEDKTGTKLLTPTEPPTQGVEEPPAEQVQEKVQEKNKSIISEKTFSDEVIICFEKCLKYFPKHLHPKKTELWKDTIYKLNKIEQVPFEKIVEIVKNAREDDFWQKHFLSLPKLRTKNKDKIMYIVVFNEKFKGKQTDYNQVMRDTMEEIKINPNHIANHLKFS